MEMLVRLLLTISAQMLGQAAHLEEKKEYYSICPNICISDLRMSMFIFGAMEDQMNKGTRIHR